ncbi:decaprenyl-phosphate phosphoribosyltransferase [Komagataeibacter sp. FXV3]|uniref:decaprenyl-phosphate phosphoribosyltransferase n=1 Tax=Komagataeibacter sp. FXV3 TaxID=2608998 RepID=UPI00187B3F8B|nr:decaprenyl-phosphate phosphoribosyltransferase [Komagataeibacter sp. FXV3]MBE7728285.1 decaprenyl-phosphate phosphoribosyltransferase [Komagataeibacter sp. FXV3]
MNTISLVRLCRPHQYIKNLFVFAGPVFYNIREYDLLLKDLLSFIAFSMMASAIYVFNDIIDVNADRQHPVKCNRPIASGKVSVRVAIILAISLVVIALGMGMIIGLWALTFLVLYMVINIGYSLRWKHIPVIDVFLISSGFMLRILIGTVGLGIHATSWILLCGLMLTLFLGFAKRCAELLALENSNDVNPASIRRVLDDYSPEMIEQFTAISAACTIICYSLYTVSPETVARHHTANLIYTVPLVVYGIFRYLFLLHRGAGGNDTAHDLLRDPHLLITGLLWLMVTIGVIVWPV